MVKWEEWPSPDSWSGWEFQGLPSTESAHGSISCFSLASGLLSFPAGQHWLGVSLSGLSFGGGDRLLCHTEWKMSCLGDLLEIRSHHIIRKVFPQLLKQYQSRYFHELGWQHGGWAVKIPTLKSNNFLTLMEKQIWGKERNRIIFSLLLCRVFSSTLLVSFLD